MAKTQSDKVEDEVRRRMVEILGSGGVGRGRISLEVLYLLPTQFVSMYRELFDRAFSDPIKPQTDGGKDEGRVKKPIKGDPVRNISASGAQSGSKKFRTGAWPIRSEEAVEAKRKLDRKLVKATEEALVAARRKPLRAAGYQDELVPTDDLRRCERCGQFQSKNWKRCPFHEGDE
jgi:hypothetical protein